MKKISLFICLIIVLNVFSACGENNKDESKATSEKANSSKTSVSNVVSESSSKETTTSSAESETGSSSESDSKVSSVLESDIISSENESSSERSCRGWQPPPITYTCFYSDSVSSFKKFMRTPYDSFSKKEIENNDILINWKKDKDKFLFVNEKGKYKIASILARSIDVDDMRRGYSVYFENKKAKTNNEPSGFNVTIRPVEGAERKLSEVVLCRFITYSNYKFIKKNHKKWGAYYVDENETVCLFRYDNYVVIVTSTLGEIYGRLTTEYLDCFGLKYISKPNECPQTTSSETSSTESSSIESSSENTSSLENNSSETQSSDISSENASSPNTTSSEETSTQ